MQRYNRADVLRILHITAQQLVQWQKAGLIAAGETFSFFDLIQIQKVRDLRAKRVRAAVIRESLEAMQKQVAGMENPLVEASSFTSGSRVVFRHAGHAVEPTSGQFVMDFETARLQSKVHSLGSRTAEEWFELAMALDASPATLG